MSATAFRIVESAAGIASLLIAAGYLSLRAHFNHLGISALEVLGVERILAESASLAQALLVFGVIAGLLLGVAVLVGSVTLRVLRQPLEHLQRRCPAADLQIRRMFWPSVAILSFVVYVLWHMYLLRTIGDANSVAVGQLEQAKMISVPLWIWFVQVATLLVSVPVGLRLLRSRADGLRGSLTMTVGAFVLASCLMTTPIVFGVAARSKSYSTAVVSLGAGDAPQCGLLVIASAEQLVLWQADHGVGRTLYLPRSRVQGIRAGAPRDIVELSRSALQDGKAYPSVAMCADLTPAGSTLP